MVDQKEQIEEIFMELVKNVESYPQEAVTYIQKTKELVLSIIQQSNSDIFSDLLEQMQPIGFENLL